MPAAATPSGWLCLFPKLWTAGTKIYNPVDSCELVVQIEGGKSTQVDWARGNWTCHLCSMSFYRLNSGGRLTRILCNVLYACTTVFPNTISSLCKLFDFTEVLARMLCTSAGRLERNSALFKVWGSSFKALILRSTAVGFLSPNPLRFSSLLSR